MENFPQSFEPVGSDSILEQFIQLKNYLNDILSSNEYLKTIEQNLTEKQKAQVRENIGAGAATINVVDNTDSTSAIDALSANQGRVLNEKINSSVQTLNQLILQINANGGDIASLQGDVSDLNEKIAKTLTTPMIAPNSTELVGIDDNNSQVGISVGNGLSLDDGLLSGISIKELWKNPNTSVNFVATTVTLNSDDYDFLLTIWGSNRNDILYENSCIVKKGNNISMNSVICSSSSPYIYVVNRSAVRNSDTSYTFDECYQSTPSGTNTANQRLIPKYIYGIKVV